MLWNRLVRAFVFLHELSSIAQFVISDAVEADSIWGWKADDLRLKARLSEIEALKYSNDERNLRPWPIGTVDFDRVEGVHNSYFAQDLDARCRSLTWPSGNPTSRSPIALLLTGQLRTAEFTLPFIELNVIDASRPSDLHVFAHVWSPRNNPKNLAETAAMRTEARLKRLKSLKAMVVEPEEDFSKIVCAFYDARYGAGWCKLRYRDDRFHDHFFHENIGSFLSQWYKLSVGHGLLRRWYRADESDRPHWFHSEDYGSGVSRIPPLAIVRMRPDHLLTVRWNLTRAALEFQERPAAQAAGGNFLAIWGPTSHSEFGHDRLCPDRMLGERVNGSKCYSSPRVDDAFAFGTPAAFDAYAAPYHPFADYCCELYVQNVLPLAGLVEVGAEQSRGGHFGSLGMPGSCGHRSGHYPLRAVELKSTNGATASRNMSLPRGYGGFNGSLQRAILEYTNESIPYGPLRSNSSKGIKEKTRADLRAKQVSNLGRRMGQKIPDGTAGGYAITQRLNVNPRMDRETAMGSSSEATNRAGLSFSELCAPVFYFKNFGVQILRYRDAISVTQSEASLVSTHGSCPPLLRRDEPSKRHSQSQSKDFDRASFSIKFNSSRNVFLDPVLQNCSDIRGKRAAAFPWVLPQLYPPKSNCFCSPPVALDLPYEMNNHTSLSTLRADYLDHCQNLGSIESKACRSAPGIELFRAAAKNRTRSRYISKDRLRMTSGRHPKSSEAEPGVLKVIRHKHRKEDAV